MIKENKLNRNGIKEKQYKNIKEFWKDYAGNKYSYKEFIIRKKRMSKMEAIHKQDIITKTRNDVFGRVCTDCNKYKHWDKFTNAKNVKTGKTPNCNNCRQIRKKKYKITANGKKRKAEEQKRRMQTPEYKEQVRLRYLFTSYFEVGCIVRKRKDGYFPVIEIQNNHLVLRKEGKLIKATKSECFRQTNKHVRKVFSKTG